MKPLLPLFLLCLPALSSPVPEPDAKPFYVRLGTILPQDGFRAFLGGKTVVPMLEMGYTLQADLPVSWNGYLGYFDARGKADSGYAGLRHTLKGRRLGLDARYQTPLNPLKVFAGFTLSSFDGQRVEGGQVPNYDKPSAPIVLQPRSLDETRAKFGYRFGVEYAVNANWGVVLDYSVSEWYSKSPVGDFVSDSGTYPIRGVNPVNPVWVSLAVQYRWRHF